MEYKAKWRGNDIVKIDPAYTSQQCSCCGYVDRSNRKSQANFECKKCNHTENADVNAARNILQKGLELQNN